MAVPVICPHCSEKLQVGAEWAGKKVRCPKCRDLFDAVPVLTVAAEDPPLVLEEADPEVPVAVEPEKAVYQGETRPVILSDPPSPAPPSRPRQTWQEPRRREPPTGLSVGLIAGLSVGAVCLLLAAGALFWFLMRFDSMDHRPQKPVAIMKEEKAPENWGNREGAPPIFDPIEKKGFGRAPNDFPDPLAKARPDPGEMPNFAPIPQEPLPPPPVAGPDLADLRIIPIQAMDLAYDPLRGHLYAAVGSTAAKKPNTVTAIDPAKGEVVWSVNVGKDPRVLAMASTGKALWVGLDGSPAFQRIDLSRRTAGQQFPIALNRLGKPLFVEQMLVLPGTTDYLVVSLKSRELSPRHGGVALFVNGQARPRVTQDHHTGSNRLAYSIDPSTLWGYNNETTEFGLRRLLVDNNGVREARVFEGVIKGFNVDITYGDDQLFATNGTVVDGRTGRFIGTIPARGPVAVDANANRFYILVQDQKTIEAYDTMTLRKQASCSLPATMSPAGPLVLLGGTVLAFRTDGEIVLVPVNKLK